MHFGYAFDCFELPETRLFHPTYSVASSFRAAYDVKAVFSTLSNEVII